MGYIEHEGGGARANLLLVKTRSAVSTTVVAIIVIVVVVIGGAAYYYASTRSGPQKTIGVVFDVGHRGDLSFNDMAYLGAQNVATQYLGCSSGSTDPCIQQLESNSANDYVTNLQHLASESNPPSLIVAVGFLMTDAINSTARQYPNQNFAIIDGFVPGLPNVLSIQFRTDQGAAVAGALAAYASSCYGGSKVGLVLGIEIPVLWTFEIGYKWGVSWAYNYSQTHGTAINSNLQTTANNHPVIYKYTGSFNDPSLGQAAATAQFNQGAIVSYNVAGSTGNGIFTAAQSLAPSGATMGPPFGIGVDSDQDWVAPGFVLASQMKRVDTAVFQTFQLVNNGSFRSVVSKDGGVLTLGMSTGAVAISSVNDVKTFLQIAQSAGKTVNATKITNQITAMRNAVIAKCGDIYSIANTLTTMIKSGQVSVPYVLTQNAVNYWRSRYG
jgi:basic membrane protein A